MAEADPTSPGRRIVRLLQESQRTADPRLLSEAVEYAADVLAAPRFLELDAPARVYVLTLASAISLQRARTSDAGPNDLDRAIEWGEEAVASSQANDANLPATQSNLATALTERYERDADSDDLDRAIELFTGAVRELLATGSRADIAQHNAGLAYRERAASDRARDGDLDEAIALFEQALDSRDASADELAGYLNSLGLSLRAQGRAQAEPELLRKAGATLLAAREQAQPGDDIDTAAGLNLAAVLQDLAEADNDIELLRQAVTVYRDVLPLLDGRRRSQATTNLATGLLDLYRQSGDRAALSEAVQHLQESASALPIGAGREVAVAGLAATLLEMYDNIGRIAVLDEAIAVQEELVAVPRARTPERILNLGVSLLARFRRRRETADLDRAVALFAETERRTGSAIERASALNSRANALSLRFDIDHGRSELDRCLEIREQAIATAPRGSLDAALYLANLGVDLLKRYELTHERSDLVRGVTEQRKAVREAPAGSAEQPRLLAGLADSLARAADDEQDGVQPAEARATYRQVVVDGREALPEQALAAALRWGAWESARQCWTQAEEAYELGMTTLVQLLGRQELRADKQSWLIDAVGLPAEAAFAHVRAGRLDRAVLALESGRAMLLADALRRRPLTVNSSR